MAGSAAKVVISERQQKVLRQLSTATTVAKRLGQRVSPLGVPRSAMPVKRRSSAFCV